MWSFMRTLVLVQVHCDGWRFHEEACGDEKALFRLLRFASRTAPHSHGVMAFRRYGVVAFRRLPWHMFGAFVVQFR
jgi:hypothetical protein